MPMQRGQPLWVMGGMLLAWVGGRGLFWEAPMQAGGGQWQAAARHQQSTARLSAFPTAAESLATAPPAMIRSADRAEARRKGVGGPDRAIKPSGEPSHHADPWLAATGPLPAQGTAVSPVIAADARAAGPALPVAVGALASGLSGNAGARGAVVSRWSGDGWIVWRENSRTAGAAPGGFGATYGASQMGAVLRYRLRSADPSQVSAYVRGYAALNGTGEREASAGLSARPVAGIPLAVMGELRVSRFAGGATHLRPALMAVSQLPVLDLSHGARLETYAQGGYVAGAGHTAFVDGQARLDIGALRDRRSAVRLGAGVWGGAQVGVGRLDIGPSARFDYGDGHIAAHLAIDWRLRVMGNAAPVSGPAITLAAGF